ncbi:MAG: hypothetical protein ACXW27_17940 [Allosphingosinicella sp.]
MSRGWEMMILGENHDREAKPMKMKRLILAVALATFAVSPAFAFHCPADMAQIDQALDKKPNLSAEQMGKVKALRAEGETLHKAGDHSRSVEVLSEAKGILGIK